MNKEEEVAEEEPVVHSSVKQTRTTLLGRGRIQTLSIMKQSYLIPTIVYGNNIRNDKNQQDEEIKSITRHMESLSLAHSHKERNQTLNSSYGEFISSTKQ